MRALFVTSPGLGHNFPLVPTAWALRSAGHEVLFAAGGAADRVAAAGLPAVDTAEGVNFAEVFGGYAPPPDATPLDIAGGLFARVSAEVVDSAVELGRRWHPDLVVYSGMQGAGPLLAAVLGVPAVNHEFSFAPLPAALRVRIAEGLGDAYSRYGVRYAEPALTVAITAASLEPEPREVARIRPVAYNGGARLPEWLLEPPERPRIAVTLGSVLPAMAGLGALDGLLTAMGSVDAEFVLALDGAEVGGLPPNARAVDWLPLNQLLPSCAAAVHHGGSGTTLAVLDAGLPSVIIPQGADQFRNAELLDGCGAALVAEGDKVDAALLNRLLSEEPLRAGAGRLAAELHAQPAPSTLVDQFANLL
ncbi:nucleotide disphospho-sugar-binding domain-containing protein [Sciscionella marina]|uniref:nucleotide disphospho-sugar-binding domain-containing protein n=1 Tax=Sciscionella marina TaxID=508770 RepID=UPI000361E7EB|nr:nucleotide disphospho-sugar-binding domain-containing protein [Sciscionella marina]